MARRYADLPLSALDEATFVIESNETSGQSADSEPRPSIRLTVQGAAPQLAALAQRCGTGGGISRTVGARRATPALP